MTGKELTVAIIPELVFLSLKGGKQLPSNKWVKITNIYHINNTYVPHYFFSINVGINVTRNAISDFLTIQNKSGGQFCAA